VFAITFLKCLSILYSSGNLLLDDAVCNSCMSFALRLSACFLDVCFVVDHFGRSNNSNNDTAADNWLLFDFIIVTVASSINLGPDGSHVSVVGFGMSSVGFAKCFE